MGYENIGIMLQMSGILYITTDIGTCRTYDTSLESYNIEETCKRVLGLLPGLIGITTEIT